MKPSIKLHHPHITTHLPAHELAAGRRRIPPPRPSVKVAPAPPPLGRKTVDTRWSTFLR